MNGNETQGKRGRGRFGRLATGNLRRGALFLGNRDGDVSESFFRKEVSLVMEKGGSIVFQLKKRGLEIALIDLFL